MAQRLLKLGHSVTVVCGSYKGAETGLANSFEGGRRQGIVDGIRVIEFELSYSNSDGFYRRTVIFLNFALRSIGLVFTESYDVLFATTTPLTAGIPGIFARWIRRKPFVFEVRDLWPELPRAMGVIKNPLLLGAMSFLEWASYRSANRIIGLSPGIVDGITRVGLPKTRVALISNGCDLDLFSKSNDCWRPAQVRSQDFLAVFSGTHGKANGLSAVLDAAAELKDRGRDDIKILLVGEGALKPMLQERAKHKGLENVIFHDPVGKTRLAGLFSSADLGLQILANIPAFYYGTSPNKFFDYIAAGLPVLTNYPGWMADLISEHQCGYSVPPDDPVEFANNLELASNNRETLKEMGTRGRYLAETEFNRAALSTKWADWVLGALC
jgi:glycosyltransferase involved in cell wall biosynthesis